MTGHVFPVDGGTLAHLPTYGDVPIAIAALAFFTIFASLPYGSVMAAIQEVTPNQMRGQIAALYLFGINLFGIGLGPTVIAFGAKVLGGDARLGGSMALVVVIAGALAFFLLSRSARPYRMSFASHARK